MRIGFLGTGGANGVPSFYCDCVACKEATLEPRARRSRSSIVVTGTQNTLIDASPDLRQQLLREEITRIDNLFLTHTHFDHAGGLPELEFYVRLRRSEPLPAYMTHESARWVKDTLPHMADCLAITPVDAGESVTVDGVRYTALEVTHTGGAVGFLLEGASGERVAYIPDTGPLPPDTERRAAGVDVLILGATFFGENWLPADHLSVDEALAVARGLRVGRVYITHVSMHYDTPVTCDELAAHIRNVSGLDARLAYDGLWLETPLG